MENEKIIELIGERDEPIKSCNEDSLFLTCQIKGFAEFIKTCETPMTISIEGDWGSGKTSFYNAVKETVQSSGNDTYVFVDFNSWQYSQFKRSDNLALDLFYSVIKKIEDKATNDKDSETLKVTRTTKERLNRLFKLTQAAAISLANYAGKKYLGEDMKEIYSDIKDSEKIRDDAKNLVQIEPSGPDGIEIISSLKNDFQKCILKRLGIAYKEDAEKNVIFGDDHTAHTDKRLIVFVDDLDRLVPDKAVEMLEALKIFLDCKYCVFILAIDYKVVVNGVKMKYKDSISENKGRDFFEKLIQVVYKMPTSVEHSTAFISKILRKYNIWPMAARDFTALLRDSEKDNPRTVKRLMNNFLLLRKVAEKQDRPAFEREDIPYPNPDTDAYLFAFICLRETNEYLYREFMSKFNDLSEMKNFLRTMNDLKNWLVYSLQTNEEDTPNDSSYATEQKQLSKTLSPLLTQLELIGNDIRALKKQKFLLTFFRTLMANIGHNELYTTAFLKYNLCNTNYINRIRAALLLTDISDTENYNIASDDEVSAVLLYYYPDEESDQISERDIITFPDEPGTTEAAYRKTVERIILLGIGDVVRNAFYKTNNKSIAQMAVKNAISSLDIDFLHITPDECNNVNAIKLECIWDVLGINATVEKLSAVFYSDRSDSANDYRDHIHMLTGLFNIYVEFRKGRSLELIEFFGDPTLKENYVETAE